MTDLQHYITRVMAVQALQLSLGNLEEAAALCGGTIQHDISNVHGFVLFVPSPMGTVIAKPGMWLVGNGKGWVAMKDQNFKHKFELASAKGERVPPYSKVDSIPIEVESLELTEKGMIAKGKFPEGFKPIVEAGSSLSIYYSGFKSGTDV